MLIQILLIGVSVSMDAFAVSIGKGLTVKKLRGVDAFKTALWFGGFQALFPLLGYFAASTFSKYVTAVDHWIIFGLLALIGGNMVREAFEEDEENAKETPEFDWKHMLPLAVACSIDAFAVGVSFAFMTLNIWLSVVIIGITTGLFSAAGLYIGRAFGSRWQKPAQIAGGIALQALEARGIKVMAHVAQIGGISDLPMDDMVYRAADRKAILTNDLPCIDAAAAGRMREEILAARDELDSIGGIVECGIYGLPTGIGDPMFDGIENRIAQIAFGIPAVKGVEFGMGFAVAAMRGSENNDPYRIDAETGEIEVESNNAGGILGGISTGAPVMWRMAVKPTPSIGREQQTVDMDAMENAELSVHGRHDPCIVPRAVPVAEAAAALAIWDALLEDAAQL